MPGVPLYPNGATTRLPPAQVAQVAGPIAKIDGQVVEGQGGVFDLLPGCHIVELERQVSGDSYSLTGGVYFTGAFPATTYALRMKAGAHYTIRRQMLEGMGPTVRVILSAREDAPGGATTDLEPAKSSADLVACKEWASATFGK